MLKQRAVIFVNGEIPDPKLVRTILSSEDYFVAADGGLNHLRRLSINPHLVIGDLDSVSEIERQYLTQSGIEIELAQIEKDESDLELAIQSVVNRGYSRILIVGALGNRLDHTLGNIFLLALPVLQNCEVRLDDGRVAVFLIQNETQIWGKKGDLVSLIPINGPVSGVETTGLYYPLNEETLRPFFTRGISNHLLCERATINVKSGCLLCIHTRSLDE